MSNLNVRRELDPPTNLRQFVTNCGKILYVSERVLFRNICNSSETIQLQNKLKTTWEFEVQQKSKVLYVAG